MMHAHEEERGPVDSDFVIDVVEDLLYDLSTARKSIDDAILDVNTPGSDPEQLPRLIALRRLLERFEQDCQAMLDVPFIDEGNDDVEACMALPEARSQ